MGILDRFRSERTPPTKPRGGSGRTNYGGFPEKEEKNVELTGRRGLEKFDEMYRTDPDVKKVVGMASNPIIGATWSVEPFGGDDAEEKDIEAAQAVEWALFTNMSPGLKGHLAEALPIAIRSGFAPFEGIWETAERDGRKLIVPRRLEVRLPRSIMRWIQDGGDLLELEQLLPTGGTPMLPIEDLVYYRFGAEGDNWEGTSLLRAAFKPWYFKDKLERIDVMKAERSAMGVPICYPPKDAKPEQLEEMEEILGGIRASSGGFIIAPGPHAQDLKTLAEGKGWRIEFLGLEKGQANVDINPSIERLTDKITAAFVADFMRLGQGQGAVGARATAESQENPFLASVEAIAAIIESALEPVVNRITALNFEVEEPPKLCMSLVDSTSLNELAEYVAKLVEKEVLHPDNELEDFLRDRGDLPPADAEAREEREQQAEEARELQKKAAEAPPAPASQPGDPRPSVPAPQPKPAPAPAPKPPAAKDKPEPEACTGAMDASERREMRWWEELMSLDEIEGAIENARSRFEAAGGEAARALAADFTEAALAGKAMPRIGDQLQTALYGEMARLYRTGRSTVADELEAQRPGTADAGAKDAESEARKRLQGRAKLASQSIGARIWQAVSHSLLMRPDDRAAAQKAGEAEAGAGLRAEAQLHAAGALNEGRQDEAKAHEDEIEGARYTSILDRRRCDSCAVADDDVLRRLDDPVRLAHIPPNKDCFGGGRCRCMEFYELRDEAPGYGGAPAPPEPSLTPPPGPGGAPEDFFEVSGGTPAMQRLVADQIEAINQVHRIPKSMPKVPIQIRPSLQSGGGEAYGQWGAEIDAGAGTLINERIRLSARALRRDPPITSAVHEIGHSLDAHGFGDGVPIDVLLASRGRDMYSSTPAMSEWRAAVTTSSAYKRLAASPNGYRESINELLARSYEQYIAERSGNEVLLAKIAQRKSEDPDMYWTEAEFRPIGEAFDRFFETRGLR